MMNNFDSDKQEEPIYDYYETRKKNNRSFSVFFIIIFIIIVYAKNFIYTIYELALETNTVENTNNFEDEDFIESPYEYNSKYQEYFGKSVSGSNVKDLLEIIEKNNLFNSDYKISIDPSFTSINGEKITEKNNSPYTLISLLDDNKNYIVCVTDTSTAYYSNGYISRISIADESEKSDSEILDFNRKFTMYFCDTIRGKDVKKLLSIIDTNNNTEDNSKVRLLFHVSGHSTTSNTTFYELTSPKVSMDTYIKEIKDDYYYFVNTHETNPDGSIYSIVISDNVYQHLYEY